MGINSIMPLSYPAPFFWLHILWTTCRFDISVRPPRARGTMWSMCKRS